MDPRVSSNTSTDTHNDANITAMSMTGLRITFFPVKQALIDFWTYPSYHGEHEPFCLLELDDVYREKALGFHAKDSEKHAQSIGYPQILLPLPRSL